MQMPQVGTCVVCWQQQMKANIPATECTRGKASEVRQGMDLGKSGRTLQAMVRQLHSPLNEMKKQRENSDQRDDITLVIRVCRL